MKLRTRILSLLVCLALLMSVAPGVRLVPGAHASELMGDEQVQSPDISDTEISVEPPSPDMQGTDIPVDPSSASVQMPEIADDGALSDADLYPEDVAELAQADTVSDGPACDEYQSSADDTQAVADELLPAGDAGITAVPEPAGSIDYAADASFSPGFSLGYAEVLVDDTLIYDRSDGPAEVFVRIGRGVVYVLGRTNEDEVTAAGLPDRLHIAFNLGGETGIAEGWVDAQRLRPMEPEIEVDAYRQFCIGLDELSFCHDDPSLPLARIAYILPETEPQSADESPVLTAAPGSTTEPAVSEDAGFSVPEATHPIIMPAVTPVADQAMAGYTMEPDESVIPAEPGARSTEYATLAPIETPEAGDASAGENEAESGVLAGSSVLSEDEGRTENDASANASGASTGGITAEVFDVNHPDVSIGPEVQPVPGAHIRGLRQKTVQLGLGEQLRLSDGPDGIILTDGGDENVVLDYTFTAYIDSGCHIRSSDVAAVDAKSGVLTGIRVGTAYIKIECDNGGEPQVLTVRVYAPPADAVLSPATLTLGVGMTAGLSSNYPSGCSFESSDESVARVDASGMVTAVGQGDAVICLTTWNGRTDTSAVHVSGAPETVVMHPEEGITIGMGQKGARVSAEAGEEGTLVSFIYESGNAGIVSVDADTGVLTPVAPGVTEVTATVLGSDPAISGSTAITVKAGPADLVLHTSSIKLGVGDEYQITEYDAETQLGDIEPLDPEGEDAQASYAYYVSANANQDVGSDVISVSTDGLITANKAGKAYVRISDQMQHTVTMKVAVYKAAGSITLSAAEFTLGVGMSEELAVQFPARTYAHYSVVSSDTDVASIAPGPSADQFTLTAHTTGEATITALTDRGKLDSCQVSVLPGTENINWTFTPAVGGSVRTDSDGAYILGVGEKRAALTAEADEGTLADFNFSSDAPEVLWVNTETGVLLPKTAGSANITIAAGDGSDVPSVAIPFVVLPRPAKGSLKLTQTRLRLGVGDTYQLSEQPDGIISLSEGCSASYTYKSSNTSVATVDADGLIEAKQAGSAKIRISTQNANVYKDLTLTVSKYSKSLSIVPELSLGAGMMATLVPGFASGAFSAVDYEVSKPGLLSLSIDLYTGVCTLTAPEPGVLDAPVTVTVTAGQRRTGSTASCEVTLLPEPQAGGIEFDFDAMRNVETDADGARYLSLGVGEKGVSVVARCTDPAVLCDFEYTVDRNGLNVRVDGRLSATQAREEYYTVTATAKNNPLARAELRVKVVPAPVSVTFSVAKLLLGVGDSFQLADSHESGIIVLTPASARTSFTYSASKYSDKLATTDILSISSDGIITAKKAGTAFVRVTAQNGRYGLLTVKISKKASKFNLEPARLQIGELSTGSLTLSYPAARYSMLSDVSSSDPELLRIERDGLGKDLVLSFSTGILPDGKACEVVISAATQSGARASATVSVLPHPEELAFKQDSYELSAGMTLETQLKFPEGTMVQNLLYESDDDDIVTIDSNGVITGINPTSETKSANITVTANPGTDFAVSASATVTVYSAPASLTFEGLPAVLMLSKGDELALPEPVARAENGEVVPSNFTYSSSDPTYVSITGNKMKALRTGKKVTIKAKAATKGVKAVFYVRVYDDKPAKLELYCEGASVNGATLNMFINEQHPTDSLALEWEASGKNINCASVSFVSSEPGVATVDELGVITACGTGRAVITAKTRTGSVKAKCTVMVAGLCENPELNADAELVLDEGDSDIISITCLPQGTGMRFKYASDNESVVSVDGDGRLTAITGGSANLTVTGQYGWQRQIHVRALYHPDSVMLAVRRLSMIAPDSEEHEAVSEVSYDSTVLKPIVRRSEISQPEMIELWTEASSDNEEVVEVQTESDATGTEPASYRLIARSEGRATVTIRTKRSDIYTSCEVIVGTQAQAQEGNGFAWTAPGEAGFVLMQGDEAPLELKLNSEANSGNNFSIGIEPEGVLSVDSQNMTLQGLVPGRVTLTLMVNGQTEDTVDIEVIPPEKPRLLYGKEAELDEELPAQANLDVSSFTADFARHEIRISPFSAVDGGVLLGTFKLDVADPALLTYDAQTCTLSTTRKTGTTQLTLTTFGGTVSSEVSVLAAPVYRALLISEYNNSGHSGDLPFSQGNINKMRGALSQSDIAGQKYKIKELGRNATEADIKRAIRDTFAGAKANDVSFIYIVSHGNMGWGNYSGQYYFSLSPGGKSWSIKNPSSFVTDSELMSWIKTSPAMRGKVVLAIDSCHSGGFIKCQSGNLSKLDNLAVITAQVPNKNASFYVNYKGIRTFEFFTRALATAMGCPVNVGAGDKWNTAPSGDTNGDGMVNVSEAFNCARDLTNNMVNTYCTKAYFVSNKNKGFKAPGVTTWEQAAAWRSTNNGEDPRFSIPPEMEDLVIIGLGQ